MFQPRMTGGQPGPGKAAGCFAVRGGVSAFELTSAHDVSSAAHESLIQGQITMTIGADLIQQKIKNAIFDSTRTAVRCLDGLDLLGCVSLPGQVGDRCNWENLREGR